MRNALSVFANKRDNNYNLIRFIAASLVLYSHSFPLAVNGADPFLHMIGMTLGTIAVDSFFVISGFLVAGSFFKKENIIGFCWARILRIYPALILSVLFCVFIIGFHYTQMRSIEYLTDPQTYSFLFKNMTLFFGLEYNLPGLFELNPYRAVNGSLWTLPYELKMYTRLAIIGTVLIIFQKMIKKHILKRVFLVIAIVSISTNISNHFGFLSDVRIFKYLEVFCFGGHVKLFGMFFVGAVYYLYKEEICLYPRLFFLSLISLFISSIYKELFFVVYTLTLPYLIFYIAYIPNGIIRNYNRMGDYSYGMYIYAFPIQQSVAATLPNASVTLMIIISFPLVFCLSFLSWHFIEKKSLKMKDNYVVFEIMLQRLRLALFCKGAQ